MDCPALNVGYAWQTCKGGEHFHPSAAAMTLVTGKRQIE